MHSPFKVMSQPGHDASKVRASGPGLDTKGVSASLPVEFTIDARDAGEGLLTVQILVRADTIEPIVLFGLIYKITDSKSPADHLKKTL